MPTAAAFFANSQDGPYLYAVGGASGDLNHNVDQTQRYDMHTDSWEVGPEFTSARLLGPLAVTASHLYMLGGDMDGGSEFDATDLVDVLDLSAWPGGTWADLGDPLPAVNMYAATTCSEVMSGGEIWVVGGGDQYLIDPYDEVYYRTTGEACADFYFGDLTREAMEQSRHRGEVAHYLLPVYNAGTETDTFDVTASGTWTVTAPASIGPVEAGEVILLAIDVEIPMGVNNGDFDTTLVTITSQGDANAIDTAELTTTAVGWLQAADIPHEVSFYSTAQCADDPDGFYLIGGAYGDTPYSEIYHYDAALDEWSEVTNVPYANWGMATTCYGGKLYVTGGAYSDNSFYEYDIASDSWWTLQSSPRYIYAASVGAWDGKIYVAGGYIEDPFIPTDEVLCLRYCHEHLGSYSHSSHAVCCKCFWECTSWPLSVYRRWLFR